VGTGVIEVERAPSRTPAVRPVDAAPPEPSHIGALDGLRGLAVAGVIAFHLGLSWLPGGFLGVDAFFVLSGYLITALLVGEQERTRTIRLLAFWTRRARRLLPAMLLLLAAIAVYARVFTAPDELGRLRGDALATLGYFANWHFIVGDTGYFDAYSAASPLHHMWSLAVEEQFYLAWPLLVLAVPRRFRLRRVLLGLVVAGVVASASASVALSASGADASRIYFGTDTKAHVILVGAALALLGPGARWIATRGRRMALHVAGIAGVGFCAWAWSQVHGDARFYYQGGSLLSALAVAAVIANAVALPATGIGGALSARPLRAVGRISYGLYLWHWPVILVVSRARTGLTGTPLLGARLATTFAIALVSYHLVEQPVRRGRVPALALKIVTPVVVGAVAAALILATVAPPVPVTTRQLLRLAFSQGPVARAHADPQRVRILVLGDSVAWTLVFGLTARQNDHGVYVANNIGINCGITRLRYGTPVSFRGRKTHPSACTDLLPRWVEDVERWQPDIVAVLVGHQEVSDRELAGRMRHLGDPVFDAYVRSELHRVLGAITRRGVDVALLTSPYFSGERRPDGGRWPEDDPARVDAFNRILTRAAARYGNRVRLVDLNRIVSVDGRYVRRMHGIELRAPDGVHFHAEGADWLAGELLDDLEVLGRAHRDVRVSASSTRARGTRPGPPDR
jgi:peptidoglycan/LPS O-acetylase OafA/YrhL/lysophospholipase L1-like esterase